MGKTSLFLLLTAAVSAATGQILFKVGATHRTTLMEFVNLPIITGLFFYGLSTALWIYVLSQEHLVNVYAFTALTFVLVYIAGALLLGESVSTQAMLGTGMVLGGLYLIVNASS